MSNLVILSKNMRDVVTFPTKMHKKRTFKFLQLIIDKV